MLRVVVLMVGVVVAANAVRHLPGGELPFVAFGYLLAAWVVYRAYPLLREDVLRVAAKLPLSTRRSGGRGWRRVKGGF